MAINQIETVFKLLVESVDVVQQLYQLMLISSQDLKKWQNQRVMKKIGKRRN